MALEDDLQELMEKRREIDRALLERHAVEMAVLFTDIVGSTAFFEQRGDIEGLALVHRHNDLLFPVVKAHRGRVIKTIGDSIMAAFLDAKDGLDCAVALQETLAKDAPDIHIRVGVHFGRVLKDGEDVFGDTVNTAARVASAADGDEILASTALVDALAVKPPATAKKALAAKGKSEPVPIVAVAWRDVDKANVDAVSPAARELFVIEVARGPAGLRVAAMDGEAERGTVKSYADVALSTSEIDKLAEPFALLAHDGGRGAYLESLVEKGRALFERTMPERVRERVKGTTRKTVRLHVEDTLVHVPWELLHDGADFLGCKFSLGRMVSARADTAVPPPSASANELVVIANPSGDLPHADEEGLLVEKLLSSSAPGRVVHASGPLSRADFLGLVKRARVLHFAGHVARSEGNGESAFVLKDGNVTAGEIASALANSAPSLVFANACHASTDKWRVDGASLAQALLLAGVRHTLAPLWSVPDADALAFALRFYESALAGVPFGECARRARKALLQSKAAPLSFAGYVLYGDPRATLLADDAKLPSISRTRSGDFPPVEPTAPTTSAPRSMTAASASSAHATLARAAASATGDDAPPALSKARESRSHLAFGAVGGIVTGAVVIAVLALHPWTTSAVEGSGVRDPHPSGVPTTNAVEGSGGRAPHSSAVPSTGAPPSTGAVASTGAHVAHTGPVRVSVMPWKSADPALKDGLTEVVSTALSDHDGTVQLIERGQIDVDVGEIDFEQTKYVDANTKAQLGKINGCEVAILGGAQPAGDQLRLTARFVDVETGEILAAAKVDGKKDDVFALEDKLAAEVKRTMHDVVAKLRSAR